MVQQTTSPRRYAVLGTGALGGFYGARLQRAGHEVHFLDFPPTKVDRIAFSILAI
jgi:ketopantoate reductase